MSVWTTIDPIGDALTIRPSIPVLAIANLKGGVGKTTLVANLACALVAEFKLRVLAIDLDFQGSLSEALGGFVDRAFRPGAANLLRSTDPETLFHLDTVTPGYGTLAKLHIIQSFYDLAEVEDRLFVKMVLGNNDQDIRYSLARKLALPRLRQKFDIVLIDTPPRLTTASVNALCASSHILIPTALTSLSQSGSVTFVDTLEKFKSKLCPHLKTLSIVPTLTQQKTITNTERNLLAILQGQVPNVPVWNNLNVPRRQSIAENRNYFQSTDIRDIFNPIASKVVQELRIAPNGVTHNISISERSEYGWDRMPN